MISVIIPLYNKEKFIVETIKSVLLQSYKQFEIIIVNDGSTDKSLDELLKINDFRVNIFSIKNSGVSNARNYGIKNAKYNWIALLDADDLWNFNYLQQVVEIINENKDVKVISTNYFKQYSLTKNIVAFTNISSGFIDSYYKICSITSSSVIINKIVFEQVGFFNDKIKYGEDQHMWLRINFKFKIYFNNQPSVYYRMQDHSLHNLNFERKDIRSDFVYYINSLKSDDVEWDAYRCNYLLNNLKPYYICDNHLIIVYELLKTISFKNVKIIKFIFYLFPRFIIKPLYRFFFLYKYS